MNKQKVYDILPIKVDVASNLKTINFYLLKTEHSLTLIDAGVAREAFYEELVDTLNSNGFSITDITEIILTHHHGDHVGLVNRMTKEHQVPVYAHEESIHRLKRDPDFLQMRAEFYERLYDEMGCGDAGKKRVNFLKEAIVKNKHQAIQSDITPIKDFHAGLKTIYTPGHSQDHIVLFNEETGDLFAGDLLIEHISTNALVEPDENGERIHTLIQHKQSLEKIKELNISCTYPGHGNLIHDTDQLLNRRIKGIENKAKKFKNMIAEEKRLTAAEVAQIYYKDVYDTQFSLVMSEIIGHLDYLEAKQEVAKEMVDGVWYYTAV